MAFKVIKISRVSPQTDLVEPLVVPLSIFDLRYIKRSPTARATFYKLTNSSLDSFYSVILPKLEESLPLVLAHFLPLTGHLKWDPQDPKPRIVVFPQQDAISLTVAETDADFSRLSDKGLRPETELHGLVPELPSSSDAASLFALQIIFFPRQGFSIGTTAHHVIMDGKTATKFNKSWAYVCKHGTIPQDFHLPTLLDRSVINVPNTLEPRVFQLLPYLSHEKDFIHTRSLKLPPAKEISHDLVRTTLELSQEKVDKLKERAKNNNSARLSTFVVTYAYVWTCMVKARGGDEDRPVRFRYTADFRDRLDPPVPDTYFGNCTLSIDIHEYKAKTFLGEDGFVKCVEILSESVKGLRSRRVESVWEVYEEGTKKMKLGTQMLLVTGSNQFGVYGSDFGWGRPVHTEAMSIYQNGEISLSARREDTGGVEIGICLKKCEMDAFLSLFTNGLDS